MSKFITSCLILLFAMAGADETQYEIHKKEYRFSTIYEMRHNSQFLGRVVTPRYPWNLRTNYDLYSKEAVKEGNGKFAILNPAAWSSFWGAGGLDIYVVDAEGNDVGYIDGECLTLAAAKYTFYNAAGAVVGYGYLDRNKEGFSIVHPDYDNVPIAYLRRHFVPNTTDYWSVYIYDTETIDTRMIKIFSAFAVSMQDKFRADH